MERRYALPSLVVTFAATVWCATASAQVDLGPSFDCNAVEAGSVPALVCENSTLAALDRKLANVYSAATAKSREMLDTLRAEQRGWIKGRDECWKSDDRVGCVRTEYERRIAELQARYRLVSFMGPVFYACDGNSSNEVVATFFETEPPTLIAERGDSTSLMFLQPAASGSKYVGRNESLWSQGDEALVVWGYGAPEMSCTAKK